MCVPSSHGGCLRPDPNRRRRLEPSFLPDDVVGRGKRPRPEDAGGGGSLARFGLTSPRGRRSGFGLPFGCTDRVDGGGLGTDRG